MTFTTIFLIGSIWIPVIVFVPAIKGARTSDKCNEHKTDFFIENTSILLAALIDTNKVSKQNKLCAARDVGGESVVCVCTLTYCDTITRVPPSDNEYIAYTSSKAGSRFKKSSGKFIKSKNVTCPLTLILEPNIQHQTIKGFGAAITDSAAINWMSLPCQLKQHLIDSYFSNNGIEYNVLRVPIGGTDFSTHKYAYNELPKNDIFLSNFSLSDEDYKYKIPMIKSAFAASRQTVYVLGSAWAGPAWMTEPSNYTTCGRLKTMYYGTFADYHIKFMEHYEAQGIPIWGITTTNEPANGFLPLQKFNCLAWTAHHMGLWIKSHLGPRIRGSKFKHIQILGIDDQRNTIPLWFIEMLEEHPMVLHYLDGVGIHAYSNFFAPPEQLMLISRPHPDKYIMATEACEGAYPWQERKVDLGSWERAISYISSILIDLNFDIVGWLDWNICLNEEGGPVWNDNFVDSPIIVSAEKKEFYKQPMFYAMGHVSKFLPRGSRRIGVKTVQCDTATEKPKFSLTQKQGPIQQAAFLTPMNTVVVVLHNSGDATTVSIQLSDNHASIIMEAKSIVTVEFQISSDSRN